MTEVKEGIVVEFGAKLAPLMSGLNLATAGVGAAAGIVIGQLARWEKAAVRTSTTWERAMAEIQTITDTTSGELASMRKELEGFSIKFGQDFEKVARARYDVISSGFTGIADSMKIMEAAGKAAVGGLTDISTTADVLTSVLMAYEMKAGDADRVAEKMFKTVVLGKVEFSELAQNIGDVVSSAHAAGVSLDEMLGAFATITLGGVSPAETATALNQLLLSMIAPGKEAKKTMAEFGISLNEGLIPTLEKLSHLDLETLTEITPNVRALKGVLTSVAEGGRRAADNIKAVETSVGSLDRAATIMNETGAKLEDKIMAQQEALKSAFGQQMLPLVKEYNAELLKLLGTEEKLAQLTGGTSVGKQVNDAIWHNLRLPTPQEFLKFVNEIEDYRLNMNRYEYRRSYDAGGLRTERVLRPEYANVSRDISAIVSPAFTSAQAAAAKLMLGTWVPTIQQSADTSRKLTEEEKKLLAARSEQVALSWQQLNQQYGSYSLEKFILGGRGLSVTGSFGRERGIGDHPLAGGSYQGEGSFNLRGGSQAEDWTSRQWQKTRKEMTLTQRLGATIQQDLAYGFQSVVGGALSDAFGPGPVAQWAASAISHIASVIAEAMILKGVMSFIGLPFGLESGGYAGLPGYAWGGYTGGAVRGGGVAGVVHAGEYVLNRGATQAIGVQNLERMNRGGDQHFHFGDINVNGTAADTDRIVAEKIQRAIPEAIRTANRTGIMRMASSIGRA